MTDEQLAIVPSTMTETAFDALAALAALQSRIEELEQENESQARGLDIQRQAWYRNIREREAAEARAQKAEAEWKAENEKLAFALNEEHVKLFRAEAEAEAVVEAAQALRAEWPQEGKPFWTRPKLWPFRYVKWGEKSRKLDAALSAYEMHQRRADWAEFRDHEMHDRADEDEFRGQEG